MLRLVMWDMEARFRYRPIKAEILAQCKMSSRLTTELNPEDLAECRTWVKSLVTCRLNCLQRLLLPPAAIATTQLKRLKR
jgi:hypothetical protein